MGKAKKLKILQVSYFDLLGRRFAGFDLQQMINKDTIHKAKQIVICKSSDDENVIKFYEDTGKLNIQNIYLALEYNEAEYLSVHSNLSITDNLLINNDHFINSDLVHHHAIHITKLSLYKMIELCENKPSILTIHDPWIFTGRCVCPQECLKWKDDCSSCKYLDNSFPLKKDNCHFLMKLKKEVYDKLDIDIVVSTPFMAEMLKESPITKNFKNVHVIPFGIDLDKFKNKISKEEARKSFGIDDEIVLFFRANITMKGTELKGTEYIIEALKQLITNKKITLITCGGKGVLGDLKERYTVIELGQIEEEEILMAYSSCDVFLMPSIGESFGLMAIEAMALSKPVVVFNNSALPYVTFAPECGVLVENKNSLKLMEAIKMLIENPEERERRGKLGRKLAEEHYDINTYHEKIMKLYKDAYNRQKYKLNRVIIKKEIKIDYNLFDVQILIKRLKKILFNIFIELIEYPEFFEYENAAISDNGEDIDYSILDVQEIIKQFNDFVYKIGFVEIKKQEQEAENSAVRYDKAWLKEAVKRRTNKFPFIYIPAKITYKILRKAKNEIIFLFANKKEMLNRIHEAAVFNAAISYELQELKNKLLIMNNQAQAHADKLELIERRIQTVEYINNDEIKNVFYYHGGSGNHGCEALVKTIMQIGKFQKDETCLCSYVADEDIRYKLNKIVKYIKQSSLDTKEIENMVFNKDAMAFSIGGYNYCGYDYGTKRLARYNKLLNDKGVKTALIGCSIEPDVLEHQEVLDDLNRFSLITARESITYKALLDKGINRNTHLVPDSAFILEKEEIQLPEGFKENNTIGINVSTLVQLYDKDSNMTYNNFKNLIQHIIDNTNYKIALIPHVVQNHNDDMKTITRLYNDFATHDRVILIQEHNCSEIKGYISKCKILVCARTHASIAGYSTNVPTLVLGYSVKSKGIARDIFGAEENYVIPVESLKHDDDLVTAFEWIENNYINIKKHLEEFMPSYKQKCYDLEKLINEFKDYGTAKKTLATEDFCIGCGLCNYSCPIKCIKMEYDKEGFIYPITDYTKCSNCDICRIKCPVNVNKISLSHRNSYAAQNKDNNILKQSSSGGVFTLLAEEILRDNGIVFGAGFDEDNVVMHMYIDNQEDLYKLRGSKYVQSDLKDSFHKVKMFLNNNKKVMFTGTPCQVFALKQYLETEKENLYCIDLVCHGVPSPKLFKEHCKNLEAEYNSKIDNVNFRAKDKGWYKYSNKYTFKDGTIYDKVHHEEPYMRAFLLNHSLRKSCYNCEFKNFKSMSDITLADYWRVEELHQAFNDNKGTSLILVNSGKGNNLLEKIKNKLKIVPSNIDYAISVNRCITESVEYNAEREVFFKK